MRTWMAVRNLQVGFAIGLPALVCWAGLRYGWSLHGILAALLAVCAFLLWWDFAVIGRRTWGMLIFWLVLVAGYLLSLAGIV